MSFVESLRRRARERPRRIVFPEGADERTVAAATRLAAEGLAEPILPDPAGDGNIDIDVDEDEMDSDNDEDEEVSHEEALSPIDHNKNKNSDNDNLKDNSGKAKGLKKLN